MRGREVGTLRTFAMLGHRASGKTSLGDRFLELAGATRTFGRVDEGSSLLDSDPESRRRRMTLLASSAWLEWEGVTQFFVDPPGADGLAYEQRLAAACVDGALIVVDGQGADELPARRLIRETEGIPRIAVISRLDRELHPQETEARVRRMLGPRAVFVQAVIPGHRKSVGLVDLIDGRSMTLEGGELPSVEIAAAREALVEAVAATDDALLERYLEELDLNEQDLRRALARAVQAGQLIPVFWASAWTGLGAAQVLNAVNAWFPAPDERKPPLALDADGRDVELAVDGPFVAQHVATRFDSDGARVYLLRIWSGRPPAKGSWTHAESGRQVRVQKLYSLRGERSATAKWVEPGALVATWEPLESLPGETWTDGRRWVLGGPAAPAPMIAWVLETEPQVESDKMRRGLQVLQTLDPALDHYPDELTLKPVVAGAGEDQLERAVGWLSTIVGASVRHHLPPVPYREAPSQAVFGAQGEHRRMSEGLVSEFGRVILDVEPAGEGFRFEDRSVEEELPERFLPGVIEGVSRAAQHGPLAGYPVFHAVIRCTGGDYDMLESVPEHFALAAEHGLKSAWKDAAIRLWEPWDRLDVWVPAEMVGPTITELSARRARIIGLDVGDPEAVIFAEVPVREVRTLGPRLLALTGGQGRFLQRPGRYDLLPSSLVADAVAVSPFGRGSSGG